MYGAADVGSFVRTTTVVLVEGERKRDALRAAGYQSLSSAGGSSWKPTADALRPLEGFQVVLWPDNDEPGRKVMDRVAQALKSDLNMTASVINWPDAPSKGDAADFLATHAPAHVQVLIDAAAPWEETDDSFIAEWANELNLTPPKPLILDFLDPDDYTVLFGDGGTGKGVVAAQWVADLTQSGWIVLLLDYERNTMLEWAPRVARFGGDLSRLKIVQADGAIWDHADRVREEARTSSEAHGGAPVYMVVDSIGYAIGGGKLEESGTAVKYKKALNEIGLPTLSLAHTTKQSADAARWPFGSVFWHNNVRHTINISRKGGDDDPRVLRNMKANRRGEFPPVEVDWSWVYGDLPERLDFGAASSPTVQRIAVALGDGRLTLKEITARVNADGGSSVKEDTVKRALERGEEFESDGKRPAMYTLFGESLRAHTRVALRPPE